MGLHKPSKQINKMEIQKEGDLYYNMNLRPRPGTVHPMVWANVGQVSIGGVFCESDWFVTDKLEPCPISSSLSQIRKLEQMALRLYASFQIELNVTCKSEDVRYEETVNKFLVELDAKLEQAGVNIESFYTGATNLSQIVISIRAEWGCKSADDFFTFKEAATEIAKQLNLTLSFRNRPIEQSKMNTVYTISLWNSSGENIFCRADGELSETGTQFMSGLYEYSYAISTIASASTTTSTEFKTKSHVPSGPFIQVCLPNADFNPYLVLSVVLATGLYGMQQRMDRGQENHFQQRKLTNNYRSLEKDGVISETFGKTLLKWFIQRKI